MKVWILEQDISRGENLGRMVKRFLENAGADSRITMYQRPAEVVSALKQRKDKPAVLFINPDAFDMKYSGLNLAHIIFEKKMDISLVLVSESIGYAYDGYSFCCRGVCVVWERFTGTAQSYFETAVLPLFDGSGTVGIFCETPMCPDAIVKNISH